MNDADLELLSAYIDNQLAAGERATLEERLHREPALRAALDELRTTVGLLRELEPLAPPRSFALDPAALKPKRGISFRWLRLGPALVAVLLAFTFLTVLVGRGSNSPSAGAPAFDAMRQATEATAAPEVAMQPQSQATAAPPAAAAAAPAAGQATAAEQPTAATLAAASGGAAAAPTTAEQPVTSAAEATTASQPGAAPALPESGQPSGEGASTEALAQQPTAAPSTAPPAAPIATSGTLSPGTVGLSPPYPTEQGPKATQSGPSVGLIALGIGALVVLLIGGLVLLARQRRG